MKRLVVTIEADVPDDTTSTSANRMSGEAFVQIQDCEYVTVENAVVEFTMEEVKP